MPAIAKPTKPAKHPKYLAWVAEKPCLVCGGPANVHHVIGYSDRAGRITKDDTLVTPLCQIHHQGPQGVHGLGSHRKFYEIYDIDLLFEAEAIFREYMS